MTNNQKIVEKCIGNIEDRILGVQNDLKAFIYIRKNKLQHNKENIGGGNIVVALSLFTCLNFLGKTYYCTIRKDKFNTNGSAKNETETFVKYMKFLQKNNVALGLPLNGELLQLIWSSFRDYLAHRLTVEPGNSVITFSFESRYNGSIEDILLKAKQHSVFKHGLTENDWIVNGDSLLANLPEIVNKTTNHIRNQQNIDPNLLLKVIGVEYP